MKKHLELTPENILGFEVNRCYRGKIQVNPDEDTFKALKTTHEVFNKMVSAVIKRIFEVMNEPASDFGKLTEFAITKMPAKEAATHFAYRFIIDNPTGSPTHRAYDKAPEMKEIYWRCIERGDKLYERETFFESILPGASESKDFISEVNQTAIEKVKSYLELKRIWRKGDFEPFENLDQDTFIKKITKFLKSHREYIEADTTGRFEQLNDLIKLPSGKLRGRLRELYQYRLNEPEVMQTLEEAYQLYSQEALGKEAWLELKHQFQEQHQDFLDKYKELLSKYREQVEQELANREIFRLPQRWERDTNFLQLIDRLGRERFWGEPFISPVEDPESRELWDKKRKRNSNLPELSALSTLLGTRQGRSFYVERLRKQNKTLFTGNGWFSLWKRYKQFEGKPYQEFRRPPAFRYPDPKFHPEWVNFSKEGCFQYKNLEVIGPAHIELTVKLLEAESKKWKDFRLPVYLDARLKTLQPAQLFKVPKGFWKKTDQGQLTFNWNLDKDGNKQYQEEKLHYWTNLDSGEVHRIEVHGGNLIYKPEKGFYLHFRYTYHAPYNQKITSEDGLRIPGTRVLAFDLGQKADAIVTIWEYTGNPSKPVVPIKFHPFVFKPHKQKSNGKVSFQWLQLPGGASFRAIKQAEEVRRKKRAKLKKRHSDMLRKLQSDRKLSRGNFFTRSQKTFKSLNEYIRNCRELHYKQLAGVILKLAEANQCHAIVHENLESYRTNVRHERRENQRLGVWTAQKTFDFLKTLCEGASMNCFSIPAAYSSQTCNQCGHWGVRFNFTKKRKWKAEQKKGYIPEDLGKKPLPRVQPGGDWFLCSNQDCCGKKRSDYYMIQADANAAKNLALRGLKINISQTLPTNQEEIRETLQDWLYKRYSSKALQPA